MILTKSFANILLSICTYMCVEIYYKYEIEKLYHPKIIFKYKRLLYLLLINFGWIFQTIIIYNII